MALLASPEHEGVARVVSAVTMYVEPHNPNVDSGVARCGQQQAQASLSTGNFVGSIATGENVMDRASS